MKNAKLKKILLSILKLLYYIAIAFVCFIAAVLIYYIISVQIHAKDENYKPGISIYTIVSPSMTPNIKVYDVVVNIRVDDPTKINVGDIITFKSQAATSEGMTITHRVIARDQLPDGTYEYMTQGDNNPEPDSSYVMFNNVIGKEILTIPSLGKVQFLIANKKSWLFLLLIPIAIYLIKEIYKLIDLVGLKKKVAKVIEEPKEDNLIDHDKQELLKQQLKKELLEELKQDKEESKEVKLIRPKTEKDGFLDKYTETVVKVEDKHIDVESTTKREVTTPAKPLITESKPIKEELDLELPKMKEYEVLQTDDLIIKEKEYLEGTKIKVVKVEDTKNKKKDKMSTKKKDNDTRVDLDTRTSIPRKNPNLKIERPDGEDIKELRKQATASTQKEPANKKKLKLNPNNVKKVNRNRPNNNKKKQLNLNPRNVKKVNRYKKQQPQQNNNKKKKQSLIIIEKVK